MSTYKKYLALHVGHDSHCMRSVAHNWNPACCGTLACLVGVRGGKVHAKATIALTHVSWKQSYEGFYLHNINIFMAVLQ
jgi:hypothetical protein